MRTLCLIALAACSGPAPEATSSSWSAHPDLAAPPEPVLTLTSDGLESGVAALITVTGATPWVPVHLAGSLAGPGDGPCLGDACIGLSLPVYKLATATADGTGTALLVLNVPPTVAPDTAVSLQAVQLDGPTTWLSAVSEWVVSGGEGDPDADLDGDGYPAAEDCDDDNAEVHPGALELCDGLDTDCDPATDEAGRVIVDRAGEFGSIADGLAAAEDGGLVEVCDGVYEVRELILRGTATLQGAGIGRTILDAVDDWRVLELNGDGPVTVRGLTLRNGTSDGLRDRIGGGLLVNGAHRQPVLLEDLEVIDSDSDYGAGLYLGSGDITLRRVTASNNVASEDGGGIYISPSNNSVLVEDSVITDNHAARGGGIALDDASGTVVDTVIERNTASDEGGGAWLRGGFLPAVFESVSSVWGFGLGSDNSPDDVRAGGLSVAHYGADETFTCTESSETGGSCD
jgi:hypothetical protein